MRASKALLALSLAVAATATISAHRLDEYLQAARIDVKRDGVAIEMVLTPGAEIANSVISALDRDGDAVLSGDEQNAYARSVVEQFRVKVDGGAVPLRVTAASFPTIEALRDGEGAIRLRLDASHAALASGSHRLSFSNSHLPGQSVYLANALVPASSDIVIAEQRRTPDQRDLTIEYAVGPTLASVGTSSTLLGLVVLLVFVRYTRRHEIAS